MKPVIRETERVVLAGLKAYSASDASAFDPVNLGIRRDTLGIVAPQASERTALEEDRGPDSRAILGGKPLDP